MSGKMSDFQKSISYNQLLKIVEKPLSTIHFVGVGGVSMYSLARFALHNGNRVSGSDREASDRTFELCSLGAKISIGHNKDNVIDADIVVYSQAISSDNPELVEAKRLHIPIVSRAEYLGANMLKYKKCIGVSGSHGKSSTVAMIDCIFKYAECNHTVLSGADLTIGEPFRIGGDDLLLYEACEYKDSFLRFLPSIAVALNLDLDHTDYFEDISSIKRSFIKALSKATEFALINGDDGNLSQISKEIKAKVITFGNGENNNYKYSLISFLDKGFSFNISRNGEYLGDFELHIPGSFNIYNATAAIAVAIECGIDVKIVAEAISHYNGIARRLEFLGFRKGREVYYDYAHHPTEIKAVIDALRLSAQGPLTVVFKPHTYSRTRSFWEDFRSALSGADYVILSDIYPAREEAIPDVSSTRLAEAIGERAKYCPDERIIESIDRDTRGRIVLMGAGDLEKIKRNILK